MVCVNCQKIFNVDCYNNDSNLKESCREKDRIKDTRKRNVKKSKTGSTKSPSQLKSCLKYNQDNKVEIIALNKKKKAIKRTAKDATDEMNKKLALGMSASRIQGAIKMHKNYKLALEMMKIVLTLKLILKGI